MNKVLSDRLWRAWFLLPHCRACQRRHRRKARAAFAARQETLSIVAVNCVGGEIYASLGLAFASPFINLSMNRNQFVTLCLHLRDYLAGGLQMLPARDGGCLMGELRAPDGLPPVRIAFPHDRDPDAVAEAFARRTRRMNYERLVFICDDQGLAEENYARFQSLPCYRKVLLTARDRAAEYPCCFQLTRYAGRAVTGKYQNKALSGLWVFQAIWDYVAFLNGEAEGGV